MTPHPPGRYPGSRHRLTVALTGGIAAILLALAPAGSAWAHGGEMNPPALDLVRQAIALIVNTPGDTMSIEDKINDAIESDDTSGVQIPLVQQAMDALDAGDLHQARTLLEQSIGARVHLDDSDPVTIGQVPPPVTGEQTGTLAAIDGIGGRHGLHGGQWALLAISTVIALAGIGMSFRLRPHVARAPDRAVTE